MLRAHTYDAELLCNFFQTTIQAELVHKRFNVQHIWDVVIEEFLEVLTCCWQVLVHHQSNKKSKILVTVEANPSETVVEDKS